MQSKFDESRAMAEIRARRQRHIAEDLYPQERDWRFVPGDGGDPAEVSEFAMGRELALERTLHEFAANTAFPDAATRAGELERKRTELKHFPILFISAPHIEDAISGTFPGVPTPMLFATSILDRHLRIDEFPAARVPRVVAVMNPPLYTPEFVAELRAGLRRHRPRLVGISNLSESHHFAIEIARIVKEILPGTVVVIGGQHENATNPLAYRDSVARARAKAGLRRSVFDLSADELDRVEDTQTLARPEEREFIDFVSAGDGPYLLFELVRLLAQNPDRDAATVRDLVWRNKERFRALPGSGQLFFLDGDGLRRHVALGGAPIVGDTLPYLSVIQLTHENRFPIFDYKLTAQVMASNGCKYSCSFCHESAEHFLYGVPKILQRAPENVIKELDLRHEQGYEAVFFDDSTFTQNPRWLHTMLELMTRRVADGGFLEWGCQTTINDVSTETLALMADAGCTYIYFGVESAQPGTERVQKARQLRVLTGADDWAGRFRDVAKWCHDVGIRVGTSLQFGLGETPQYRDQTLELIADLYGSGYIAPGCVALNINAPYPGTLQWFEALRDKGNPLPDYRKRLVRHPAFETAHQFTRLASDVVDDIYRKASELLTDAILSVNFEAYEAWRVGVAIERGQR